MIDIYVLLFTCIMSAFAYLIGRMQGFYKGYKFALFAAAIDSPTYKEMVTEVRAELRKRTA